MSEEDIHKWTFIKGSVEHLFDEDVMAEKLAMVIKPVLEKYSDEGRLAFVRSLGICSHCGSLDSNCQCWNDE